MYSEADIEQVSSFTGTTRDQAIVLLKKYHEADKAVNAYLDDGEKALQEDKRGWEEAPPYHNTEIPYGPEPLEGSMFAGAPSRPPSRIDSQRDLVDLTNENAPTGNLPSLSKEQQEEQDFQRALSNSMNEMGTGQRTGVTRTGQQFGPAIRDYYDKDAWSMVPLSIAREVINEPAPQDRQRKSGEPAFLRPSLKHDRLPAILTILHSIPRARDALMLKDISTPRYGFDEHWWNGQAINVPKITSLDEDRSWEDVVYEVQRIMAFLDSTTRAYGSSDAFTNLEQYCRRTGVSETPIAQFFETWDAAAKLAERRSNPSTVFSSTAVKNVDDGPELGAKKDFYSLEPPLDPSDETMYDVLDRIIWSDSTENLDLGFEDTFIKSLGPVFTVQFTSNDSSKEGCGVSIPATWYPDRYLRSCRDQARDMRRRAQEHRRVVEKIERQIEHVLSHKLNNGKTVKTRDALLQAAAAAERVGKSKIPNGLDHELVSIDEGKAELSIAEAEKCAAELREVVKKIDLKVEALNVERDKALAAYRKVLIEMTQPSFDPAKNPTHKYVLCGVSTLPHVTYFRQRREVDLLDGQDNVAGEWEWWRASFSCEDGKIQQQQKAVPEATSASETPHDQFDLSVAQILSHPEAEETEKSYGYTMKRVSEDEVLDAAKNESKTVLVVFASTAAVNFKTVAPNESLQAFVRTDNEAFAAELRGNEPGSDIELSSTKSSATLANDEYHVKDGDSELEPLIDVSPVETNPQTPLSPQSMGTVTYRRGGDEHEGGPPSPKRSKGFDEGAISPSIPDHSSNESLQPASGQETPDPEGQSVNAKEEA